MNDTFLKKHLKKIIIIIFIALFLFAIPFIIHYLNQSRLSFVNEEILAGIPSEKINDLKKYLERDLGFSKEDLINVSVRDNSLSIEEIYPINNSLVKRAIFLIDLEKARQTLLVNISWSDTFQPTDDSSLIITCPMIKDMKSPSSDCNTPFNSSHNVDLWLPYETTIKNQKVLVKSLDNSTLQIYLYSCNSDNPPIKETEEKVKDWVKNEVKDPLADKYQYNVRTGYCEGDPI